MNDELRFIRYQAEIEDAFKENAETVVFAFGSRQERDTVFAGLDEWLEHHDFGACLHTEVDGEVETAYMLIVMRHSSPFST